MEAGPPSLGFAGFVGGPGGRDNAAQGPSRLIPFPRLIDAARSGCFVQRYEVLPVASPAREASGASTQTQLLGWGTPDRLDTSGLPIIRQ